MTLHKSLHANASVRPEMTLPTGAAHLPLVYPQSHDNPLDLILIKDGVAVVRTQR
jgi:hypothetical protein